MIYQEDPSWEVVYSFVEELLPNDVGILGRDEVRHIYDGASYTHGNNTGNESPLQLTFF
ncbi:MAG: hypothetical protein AAF823_04790 [Planctomycetota bacterium]